MWHIVGCFDNGTGPYLVGYLPPCRSIGKHDGVYTCMRPSTCLPLYTCASIYETVAPCPFTFLFPHTWLLVQTDTNRCLGLGKLAYPTNKYLSDGANIDAFQATPPPFTKCVLVASIWLIVASPLLMALGTRGRNFAASDKPVFHGFETYISRR